MQEYSPIRYALIGFIVLQPVGSHILGQTVDENIASQLIARAVKRLEEQGGPAIYERLPKGTALLPTDAMTATQNWIPFVFAADGRQLVWKVPAEDLFLAYMPQPERLYSLPSRLLSLKYPGLAISYRPNPDSRLPWVLKTLERIVREDSIPEDVVERVRERLGDMSGPELHREYVRLSGAPLPPPSTALEEVLYRTVMADVFLSFDGGNYCREVESGDRQVLWFSGPEIMKSTKVGILVFQDSEPLYEIIVDVYIPGIEGSVADFRKRLLAVYQSILSGALEPDFDP